MYVCMYVCASKYICVYVLLSLYADSRRRSYNCCEWKDLPRGSAAVLIENFVHDPTLSKQGGTTNSVSGGVCQCCVTQFVDRKKKRKEKVRRRNGNTTIIENTQGKSKNGRNGTRPGAARTHTQHLYLYYFLRRLQ